MGRLMADLYVIIDDRSAEIEDLKAELMVKNALIQRLLDKLAAENHGTIFTSGNSNTGSTRELQN